VIFSSSISSDSGRYFMLSCVEGKERRGARERGERREKRGERSEGERRR
jgi:hypothetical protein